MKPSPLTPGLVKAGPDAENAVPLGPIPLGPIPLGPVPLGPVPLGPLALGPVKSSSYS